jgi:hypothetical protein
MADASPVLKAMVDGADTLADLHETLATAIVETPPLTVREGGMISPGYHEELDTLRRASTEGKDWIAALEATERERTGIKSLKVGPDSEGDKGRHVCRYAILPHEGGFSAQTVVQPAYCFNYLPLLKDGTDERPALLSVDAPGIIVETVKPCEDTGHAYILRLYESTGAYVNTTLSFGHTVKSLALTNMLEEEQEVVKAGKTVALTFRPFEIKTLRVVY